MVDQRLVVLGLIAAIARRVDVQRRQGRGHPPVGACRIIAAQDLHRERPIAATIRAIEQRAAVEETTAQIEVGLAHRGVEGEHPIPQRQRACGRRTAQRALVETLQRHCRLAAASGDVDDVLGEVADQVAPANPRRHAKHLTGRVRLGHGAGDLEQMLARCSGANDVVNGRHGPRENRRAPIMP